MSWIDFFVWLLVAINVDDIDGIGIVVMSATNCQRNTTAFS